MLREKAAEGTAYVFEQQKDKPTAQQRDHWRKTLDPAWRLPTKKTPIAWFTGTNDRFYRCKASETAELNAPKIRCGQKRLLSEH